MKKHPILQKRLLSGAFWLFLAVVLLMLVGGVAVLYASNQNTKFLIGLARAGKGLLKYDWLANTKDPLPAFTALVYITYRYLNEAMFYVYHVVLVAVYLFSLVGIADHVFKFKQNKAWYLVFLAVYLISYSRMLPVSIHSLLYSGLAYQDFSFNIFLPNAFAALLFLSIYLYLKEKSFWAIVAIGVAGTFHTGYLIGGAALVTSYLVIDFWETKNLKKGLLLGSFAALLVSPVVLYNWFGNQTATPEQADRSVFIFTSFRIPHHTMVDVWWDNTMLFRLALILIAAFLVRKTKLWPILVISFGFITVPLAVMFVRPSTKIAILQLWRVSVIAVPLASTLIIAWLVSALSRLAPELVGRWRWATGIVLGGVLFVALGTGVQAQAKIIIEYRTSNDVAMMHYVSENAEVGDVYLHSAEDRALDTFRIEAGVPIFVNWKSHPYSAVEVIEWYERNLLANKFYNQERDDRCEVLDEIVEEYGITHVILSVGDGLRCSELELQKVFDNYVIYKVVDSSN